MRWTFSRSRLARAWRPVLSSACLPAALAVLSACQAGANAASSSPDLRLATWNMEWLIAPAERAALGTRCMAQQPRSDERAIPCAPGHKPPPVRSDDDFAALARTAGRLHDEMRVDLVGLQEVDGAPAAREVFRHGWRLDCFIERAHPQKVGFAIREGVPYRCNGDLKALDVDGSTRAGADITLFPGTGRQVRVLAVHLKSGCFDGRLDRRFTPCQRLREQVPVLERWVDDRVREGVAFAILGDFNRHLNRDARFPAGDDESSPLNLVQALSDDEPRGAVLIRATEGAPSVPCDADDRHSLYIDDVLVSESLSRRASSRAFARVPYDAQDRGRILSDHCPLVYSLQGALK